MGCPGRAPITGTQIAIGMKASSPVRWFAYRFGSQHVLVHRVCRDWAERSTRAARGLGSELISKLFAPYSGATERGWQKSSSAPLAETHMLTEWCGQRLRMISPQTSFVRPVKCRRFIFFCVADGAAASDRNGSANSLRHVKITGGSCSQNLTNNLTFSTRLCLTHCVDKA